ncbi:MAG: TonB-dependent receptor [Gammaproteobacteria bacterium]|nr:TonB-dependent receptor [Gammaproteobacteria bacterium]
MLIKARAILLLAAMTCPLLAVADHPAEDSHEHAAEKSTSTALLVDYPARFFDRYQPNSALDMVNELPGFQLDDGADVRGFTNAAGNILINGQRPSVKQDTPAQILGRIPASNVVKVELIRGQTTSIDLQGQQVVANVVLRQDSPAAVRWEAYVYDNTNDSVIMPGGSISLSDQWSGIDINVGIGGNRHAHNSIGSRNSYAPDGSLLEDRSNDLLNKHLTLSTNLNASGWIGETLLQVNTEVGYDEVNEWLVADRVPQDPDAAPFNEKIVDDRADNAFEIGISAERNVRKTLTAKGIVIFVTDNTDEVSTQRVLDENGDQTLFRISDTSTDVSESIARLEFDWMRFENHQLQLNAEFAFNALEGALFQTVDRGDGPEVEAVPGANTRVEEDRFDILLADTWRRGHVEVNIGLGAEASTLTQTGDADLKRDFFFVKPHAVLSYSPRAGRQTRFRLAREVSQLDFNDFVSSTVFQDDDLALGNPNLKPETTWVADLSQERRFGDIGVVTARLYHHWVDDVEDLLPLSADFEAPGNIGDGRRWGIELETTLPLDRLGLASSRIDVKARWQDSSVTDPVTGDKRRLSVDSARIQTRVPYNDVDVRYIAQADFRQDLESARVSWGFSVISRGKRRLYKVDELDTYDEGVIVNPFVETTRWLGLKIQLRVVDLLAQNKTRERIIYSGQRDLSPVERIELTDINRGKQFELVFIGSF